jgi:hypothetical protein
MVWFWAVGFWASCKARTLAGFAGLNVVARQAPWSLGLVAGLLYPACHRGVIAIALGKPPTLIGGRAMLAAVRIGVTVPEAELAM